MRIVGVSGLLPVGVGCSYICRNFELYDDAVKGLMVCLTRLADGMDMPMTMGLSLGDKSSFRFSGDGMTPLAFAFPGTTASLAFVLDEISVGAWGIGGGMFPTGADSLAFRDFQKPRGASDDPPFRAWSAAKSTKHPACDRSCGRCTGFGGAVAPWGLEKSVTTLIPAFAFCRRCRPFDLFLISFCTEYLASAFREFVRFVGLGDFLGVVVSWGLGDCVIRTAVAAFDRPGDGSSSSSHHSSSERPASELSSKVFPTPSVADMGCGSGFCAVAARADILETRLRSFPAELLSGTMSC